MSRVRRKTSNAISLSSNPDSTNHDEFSNDWSGRSSTRNSANLQPTIEDQTATSLQRPQMNSRLNRCPPENILVAAVRSLEDDNWLTTTAIQLALGMLPSNNARIFDPSYMNAAKPESMLRTPSKSRWLDVLNMFPTNNLDNHWPS